MFAARHEAATRPCRRSGVRPRAEGTLNPGPLDAVWSRAPSPSALLAGHASGVVADRPGTLGTDAYRASYQRIRRLVPGGRQLRLRGGIHGDLRGQAWQRLLEPEDTPKTQKIKKMRG
jgi:hypothetical protein